MPSALFVERDGGSLYVGPLGEALSVALTDRRLHITYRLDQSARAPWFVELSDCTPETHVVGVVGTCPQGAEWGAGHNLEMALRLALSAYFGPVDEEYQGDESLCKLLGVAHG